MQFASYPSLRDRAVFITGGASGIGASIVEHFAAQGSRVAFVDVDDAAAAKTVAAIRTAGHAEPHYQRCDLRDIAALKAAIAAARARIGPIAVLVNNAARDDRHTIDEATPEYFDERIAVNFRHHVFAAQAVLPDMRAARAGSIINFGSISWLTKNPKLSIYQAAKAATWGFTRGLARDVGPDGVRVNCVVPGWIMTERQLALWLTPDSEVELMRSQCLKEKLYPPDIARMVLWLAADDSRLVTAQQFIVDGGWF
jgi:NAD(P)-dependent dehydrogenase (short-subunit alcohol dehydrogenase family)